MTDGHDRRGVPRAPATGTPTGVDGTSRGSVLRGLLWVVGGLVVTVLLFAAVSPELVSAAPGRSAGLAGLVLLAGIPGALLLGVAAQRRRRLERDLDREG